MPTLNALLASSAERLLVGRETERKRFEAWLSDESGTKAVLNVFGPGGFGKTTLVRSFAREATAQGRTVLSADGRDAAPSAGGLLEQLGAVKVSDVAEAVGDGGVLVLDTFEAMERLTPFLQQELLSSLPRRTKVVIAGRAPLGRAWDEWRKLIVPMPLSGLKPAAALEYLRRRDITDAALARSIQQASGGHPLALALAADLAEQFGIRDFAAAGEWQLAINGLAAGLMRDVSDPRLRSLLEAASIVFRFDESILEAISGETGLGEAFARLCALTIVRPTSRGLTLHDEIRGILKSDLRWRRPDRHREMRERAFRHLTTLMGSAGPAERARLHIERIALVDDDEMQRAFFSDSEPGRIWLDEARPSRAELQRIAQAFAAALPETASAPAPEELSPQVLDALLEYRSTRFQVARDQDGSPLAYGFCLPISEEALDLVPADGAIAALAAAWCRSSREALPPTPTPDAPLYLSTIVVAPEASGDAVAVLARGILPVIAATRRLLAATGDPIYQAQLGATGFRAVDGFAYARPDGRTVHGYQLDLTVIGGEAWVEAIASRRSIPEVPAGEALERAIDAALSSWNDPQALAASPLLGLARFRAEESGSELADAAAVRGLLGASLGAAKQTADRDRLHALRVLELATIDKSAAAGSAAERLHVSRATFYRQRKRGLRLVTEALSSPPAAGRLARLA